MDIAKGPDATEEQLTLRMLFVNFGAIHTSSMTFMHAFYYLASDETYMKLLRSEVDEVVEQYGWTKDALDMMVIVDSFLKECQRLHAPGLAGLLRRAAQDFTFSNGITIPRGTIVGASILETHLDSSVYTNPLEFDPLRYVKLSTSSQNPSETQFGSAEPSKKKYDITAVSLDSLIFGYGRHACPGRFFAAAELKLMMAYLVRHYDVKLENGVKERPRDLTFGLNVMPNPFARAMFRKRR
ncbi:hypothetical protein CVT24_012640 [Panaeolus cyanescens]|uniref:Cytochrome P450 n=1 Tax=Panaeolus cyanescens TaxID=181874 RepID=A0A409W2D8_9AGAR|nr:hypothetical protein CVT24_012640 [Panaeolus cyanescens]